MTNSIRTRRRISKLMQQANSPTDRGRYEIALLRARLPHKLYQDMLGCELTYRRCLELRINKN
jgi:hypothetical protein